MSYILSSGHARDLRPLKAKKMITLMSANPASRFGFESGIREGAAAKFCVYDLDEQYTVCGEKFASMGHFTPFEGIKVYGKCLMTVCGDKMIKHERNHEK